MVELGACDVLALDALAALKGSTRLAFNTDKSSGYGHTMIFLGEMAMAEVAVMRPMAIAIEVVNFMVLG